MFHAAERCSQRIGVARLAVAEVMKALQLLVRLLVEPLLVMEHVQRQLGLPLDRLNVNGGAIALGHPLGCTGAKLVATALHELRRRKGRYAIVTMCIGGGMGAAGLLEAYPA